MVYCDFCLNARREYRRAVVVIYYTEADVQPGGDPRRVTVACACKPCSMWRTPRKAHRTLLAFESEVVSLTTKPRPVHRFASAVRRGN